MLGTNKQTLMRHLFVVLGLCLGMLCHAQHKYTEVIQGNVQGGGSLVLHQSPLITDMVNGKPAPSAANTASRKASHTVAGSSVKTGVYQYPDSTSQDTLSLPQAEKVMVNGYRIQVYSGGNTRKGKAEATQIGQKVKSLFPELPVYTRFASPHWICRVGDFRTYEEANEYFRQLKESGRFPEAVIVKSKVAVFN